MSILLDVNPQSESFADYIDEALNAQAALEWRLKQMMQVRANLFLLVFEKG